MSKESWTITSQKRKISSTPAPRKRPRLTHNAANSSSSRPRQNQQTLTQAQWVVPLPMNVDEDELQFRDIMPPPTAPKRRSPRCLKKRDSTLTQMDFLSFPPPDHDDFDDTMMDPIEETRDPPISQCDGTYESPRRPRKRKSTATKRSSKQRDTPAGQESQDYKPSKRRRKTADPDVGSSVSTIRSSGRLAAKKEILSDPAQNFDYFEAALGSVPDQAATKPSDGQLGYPLEIKDSTESNGKDRTFDLASGGHLGLPQTPKKNRAVIFSSQSPESLPPNTPRTARKGDDIPALAQRPPLVEKSANIASSKRSRKSSRKSRTSPHGTTAKRKIVVLKLPRVLRARHSTRPKDSHTDIWSVPSSSQQGRGVPKDPSSQSENMLLRDAEMAAPVQAEPVRSSPPEVSSQESLPMVDELVGAGRAGARGGHERNSRRSSAGATVMEVSNTSALHDFAFPATKQANLDEASQPVEGDCPDGAVTSSKHPAEPPRQYMVVGEDGDFGSPIANDTQFNIAVDRRVSSPPPAPTQTPVIDIGTTGHTVELSTGSPTPRGQSVARYPELSQQSVLEVEGPSQMPMPVPRLVASANANDLSESVKQTTQDDMVEVTLPKPAPRPGPSTYSSATKIPLNDIPPPPSSPSLPPKSLTQSVTQKSIHPASLPHPSQMSTQEATQGLLDMSSDPQQGVGEESDEKTEKITIKDSSSCHISLSQVPRYEHESQSQLDIDLGLDEVLDTEEEGDLDLDPPSLSPQAPRRLTDANEHASADALDRDEGPTSKEQDSQKGDASRSHSQACGAGIPVSPIRSSQLASTVSSPTPPASRRQYSPIPGFDNDTQSNFTQNGHVTAAYIHRQREAGVLPKWYVPQPYKVPGYTRSK